MNQETSSVSTPPLRNRAARASFFIGLVFFMQCAFFLATIVFLMSPWGTRFISADPNHPLFEFGDVVVELSILFFPVDLIAGALAILLGARGRRTARGLPGRFGAHMATIGIVLGSLVLCLPFVIVFCWASGFIQ